MDTLDFVRYGTIFMLVFAIFAGCDRNQPGQAPEKPLAVTGKGCLACHSFTLDAAHDLGCVTCHGGVEAAAAKEEAHAGLVRNAAHPDHMGRVCGRCHRESVEAAAHSLHFTLKNEVNAVRTAFGAETRLDSLVDVPMHDSPDSVLALADDMLRRRCLRCHVYGSGDAYYETRRGTGCAACHLQFERGGLRSHAFVRTPADSQCLHCHYGNRVGADYYGRFEHDFSWEFRTPYLPDGGSSREYGVEYHQLAPDIHQRAGLACVDCHGQAKMKGEEGLSCEACHRWRPGTVPGLDNLVVEGGVLFLQTRLSGRKLPVPQAVHPVHQEYQEKAACEVCHAQWAFNDTGLHLLRLDSDDYEPWEPLTVQGSSEVEARLRQGLYGEDFEMPVMQDGITGDNRPGIWLQGYGLRRWEEPLIRPDAAGRLRIMRPVLDLHLSHVDAEGELRFDSVATADPDHGLRSYSPHTTGRAGAFYRQRLEGRQ